MDNRKVKYTFGPLPSRTTMIRVVATRNANSKPNINQGEPITWFMLLARFLGREESKRLNPNTTRSSPLSWLKRSWSWATRASTSKTRGPKQPNQMEDSLGPLPTGAKLLVLNAAKKSCIWLSSDPKINTYEIAVEYHYDGVEQGAQLKNLLDANPIYFVDARLTAFKGYEADREGILCGVGSNKASQRFFIYMHDGTTKDTRGSVRQMNIAMRGRSVDKKISDPPVGRSEYATPPNHVDINVTRRAGGLRISSSEWKFIEGT